MGLFIEPSSLPGGREWARACSAALKVEGAAGERLQEGLACASSSVAGLIQVLSLLAVYGFILYNASGLIASGSELLLLVPSLRNIVGSVVLPVLGAVPDGCIVFFSGLGKNAQEEIAVGVGALAGSTSMLLTVPWFLSILAGRVNIRPDGSANYTKHHWMRRWSKLMPPGNASMRGTGVEPTAIVATCGKIMLLTAISYVVIQIAAFSTGNFYVADQTKASTEAAAAAERPPAAVCFVVTSAFFIWYLYYQLTIKTEETTSYREDFVDEVRQKAIRNGNISLTAAFREIGEAASAADEASGLLVENHKKERLRHMLLVFFNHYDINRDHSISTSELGLLMNDLGERLTADELHDLASKMDTDDSGTVDFDEFAAVMPEFIRDRVAGSRHDQPMGDVAAPDEESAIRGNGGNGGNGSSPQQEGDDQRDDGNEEEEEEEDEEVPSDLQHDDPKVQIQNILNRSFSMMLLGTLLVLIFSDPMVDVLSDIGARIGVPPFYISFILAPLASNASELFASYQYATKKTRKTVSISFSTLLGAAILNNTFVLAIFMALICIKGLAWQFTAETISILFVELVVFFFSQKKIMTLQDGYIVLAMFPMALIVVLFLENVLGLD